MTELVENSWVFVEENPWAKAIGIVLLIVSVFGIIYAVRLRNQARMRAEVQNILFEYYPLQDEFDLGESGPNRSHSVSLLGNAL